MALLVMVEQLLMLKFALVMVLVLLKILVLVTALMLVLVAKTLFALERMLNLVAFAPVLVLAWPPTLVHVMLDTVALNVN